MTVKVTFLTTSFPLREDSTSGIFVAHLVMEIVKNTDVTVLTPAGRDSDGVNSRGRLKVIPCRYAPRQWQFLAHGSGGIPVALKNAPWTYLLLPGMMASLLMNCIRDVRSSDVVHANWAICGCIAGIACWIHGVPLVTTLRGEDVTRARTSVLDRFLLALCLRMSHRVVSVSRDMHRWLCEQFPAARDRITVIENGVGEDFLAVGSARGRTATEGRAIKLVTVGSLIPRKGVDQILVALRMLREMSVDLTIAGTGPEERALREIVAAGGMPGRVIFAGEVAHPDIPCHLAAADIFVLASHSEGRPNVLLEAMAAGLPVIATDIPGVRELVEHGRTGLLFADGDVGGLRLAIERLATDAEFRRELGERGHAAIAKKKLTWHGCATKYIELYQQLAGSR